MTEPPSNSLERRQRPPRLALGASSDPAGPGEGQPVASPDGQDPGGPQEECAKTGRAGAHEVQRKAGRSCARQSQPAGARQPPVLLTAGVAQWLLRSELMIRRCSHGSWTAL